MNGLLNTTPEPMDDILAQFHMLQEPNAGHFAQAPFGMMPPQPRQAGGVDQLMQLLQESNRMNQYRRGVSRANHWPR